jgi:hypothetical protein
MVDMGHVPSAYCCARETPDSRMFRYMSLANYAFRLQGTKVIEIKNRYGTLNEFEIDELEAVALKLKSVLLYP